MEQRLTDIQKTLRAKRILTCFSGRFSQGLIEEMGEAIKKHMESEERPKNDIFNVFSIFIEQTQNIKNYMSGKETRDVYQFIVNSAIVCIGTSAEGYFIWSGNNMESADIPPLRSQLEIIASLDKDGLKKLYREQIKKDVTPGKVGAGIGLIDIARKASQPIEYCFEPIDDRFSFYEIKVFV